MIQLTNEQHDRLKNRLQGLCSGAYMGDLLGFPWECMTREVILKETGGRGVEGTHTPFKPRRLDPQWGDRLEYRWSDDWRLTRAIGEALCRDHSMDAPLAHVQAHLRAMREGAVVWGPTVLAGLASRQVWLDTRGIGGLSPTVPVPVTAANQMGTGVLMKISLMALPALFEGLGASTIHSKRSFLRELYDLGRLTHAGDAVLVTIPYVLLIAQYLDPRRADGEPRVVWKDLEGWIRALEEMPSLLDDHASDLRASELVYSAAYGIWDAFRLLDEDPSTADPEHPFLTRIGRSEMADEALARNAADPSKIGLTNAQYALVQALLLDSPGPSLPAAVLAAVNRGGDTDTHGCITGAYAGAYHGWNEETLPDWWKEHDAPARAFAAEMFERYVIPRVQIV